MTFLGLKPFGWIFLSMEVGLLFLVSWLNGRYEVKLTVGRRNGGSSVSTATNDGGSGFGGNFRPDKSPPIRA